jgi:hypothetical protein
MKGLAPHWTINKDSKKKKTKKKHDEASIFLEQCWEQTGLGGARPNQTAGPSAKK